MAQLVLLRAANVGGSRVFRPAEVARGLKDLDVVSIGAAGTFVVRGAATAAQARAALQRAIRFETEILAVAAREFRALFAKRLPPTPAGAKRFATLLAGPPGQEPVLPLERPEGAAWQIRVVARLGAWVVCDRRAIGDRPLYPNPVVEKAFGCAATTRGWETLLKARAALGDG